MLRRNHVIIVLCVRREGANTQLSVLFGMACLHDSSNFDFTPTGQKRELDVHKKSPSATCGAGSSSGVKHKEVKV